jgi:flagellar biosynthetic protein FliR
MGLTGVAVEQFVRFLLVAFRITGMLIITPMLGGSAVPRRIRVLAGLVLSAAIFPVLSGPWPKPDCAWSALVIGFAGELAVGLVCGFVVNTVFVAAQMAGGLLSRHMGAALAEVINPLFQSDVPVLGGFFHMFALVVFVMLNGHHVLLAGLVKTFDRVPLMGASFHRGMVGEAAGLMGDMFVLTIKLAAPTFAALFLVTIVLGVVARTLPQIHVLGIGFPLQVCVGLVVMALSLGTVAMLLGGGFTWMSRQIDSVLNFMVAR